MIIVVIVVIVILLFIILYFFDNYRSEKDLRERIERQNKSEKSILEYKLERVSEEIRIKDIIHKIKDLEKYPIINYIERDELKLSGINAINGLSEISNCLVTSISSGDNKIRRKTIIIERKFYYPNLEIRFDFVDYNKKHYSENNVITFRNISETKDSEILRKYLEMVQDAEPK